MEQPLSHPIERLVELGVPHRVFRHDGPVESLEQAAIERHQLPQQVIRSLLFRINSEQFLMVLIPGPGQVPWKSLRKYLKQSRLTMASEEEVFEVTGCRPGTVNPFTTQQPVRFLIERKILSLSEVSFGSCERGVAILLTPNDMLKALPDYEIVDFLD
ncbi:MAG: YbaK/EbsC family protein [Anaerolineaceae bacterium]|nr:YbaK/EbsC family protein [Anaerolineaceae bacterium]